MKDKLTPVFQYVGVATVIVLGCVSLGIPPLWSGLLAGSISIYLIRK